MVELFYLRKGVTDYTLLAYELTKEGNSAIDTVKFSTQRENDSVFGIGDEVFIGYDSGGFVKTFAGYITTKELNETLDGTIESYGGVLNRTIVNEVYTSKSPEYIADDLITNYTDLTFASTDVSGVTISKIVFKDITLADAMKQLLDLLLWQIRTDVNKNLYFEPAGNPSAALALTVGTNCWVDSGWTSNPNKMINEVILAGDVATFNTQESFVATASQTVFSLTYKPTGNVRVTDDGTEVVGGKEGSTGTYDYTWDDETKTVTFGVGRTLNHVIVIAYEYTVPIKVTGRNDTSIAAYGLFSRKLTNNSIKTMADARKFVNTILSTYSTPLISNTINVPYEYEVDTQQTVQVTDEYNGIDQELVINKYTLRYPEGAKEIEVGVATFDILSWNQSVNERLNKLEQSQDNSDVLQKYQHPIENINATVSDRRIRVRTLSLGHSWIVGSSTNGLVGTNTGTEDGEQQVVGSAGRVDTTIAVINTGNSFTETFEITTFDDTASTTADWAVTPGQLDLTAAEVAQSLTVAKDGSTFTYATLTVDDATNLTLYLSADGGAHWEACTNATLHTFTTTGTDLRFKLIASGNATVTLLTITYG